MKKCVFAGTFDPLTVGHKDIVLSSLEIFDEVVVAILINPNKKFLCTLEERKMFLEKTFKNYKNVRIVTYDGLLVDLLKQENTKFFVRGIRNSTDYDYETLMHYTNSDILKELITIYLPTKQKYLHISSSLVKDLLKFGCCVDDYVPEEIREDIRKIAKLKRN